MRCSSQPLAAKLTGALMTLGATLHRVNAQQLHFPIFRLPNAHTAPLCDAEFLSVAVVGDTLDLFGTVVRPTGHAFNVGLNESLLSGSSPMMLTMSRAFYVLPGNLPTGSLLTADVPPGVM